VSPGEGRQGAELKTIFSGKKEKWLPLFRRMLARFVRIGGVDLNPAKTALALSPAGAKRPVIGMIRVTSKGLRVALALRGADTMRSARLKPTRTKSRRFSHEVLIAEPADIDEELLAWIKAAKRRART